LLEENLEDYQQSLAGLKSFVKELKTMTTKHGTDPQHFEEDLREAEHTFYEAEIVRVKKEIGGPARPGPTQPGVGPSRPGITSLIFSSIGFIAGTLFGSTLKSRKDNESSH
jgi:hypothetical protein